MFSQWKNYLKARESIKAFNQLSQKDRNIVFYAEDKATFIYFRSIIDAVTKKFNQQICYLTSEADDPILNTDNSNIKPFFIGEGVARTIFFMNLKADVIVMTVPEIECSFLKRSKVYPVHYVYTFHSLVSTHLAYNKGAFDHYNTIFCVGKHHTDEIRETEKVYNLKPKNLVNIGYGRLDDLIKDHENSNSSQVDQNHVLLAPSWGEQGIIKTIGLEIINVLLESGFRVTLRPHPMTIKKHHNTIKKLRKAYQNHPNFTLEVDIRFKDSLDTSFCLITDWSGISLEYAFTYARPIIYIDVGKKLYNPDYQKIGIEPLEFSIRERVGQIVAPDNLDILPERLNQIRDNLTIQKERLQKIKEDTVFNLGNSGEVGAQQILNILNSL